MYCTCCSKLDRGLHPHNPGLGLCICYSDLWSVRDQFVVHILMCELCGAIWCNPLFDPVFSGVLGLPSQLRAGKAYEAHVAPPGTDTVAVQRLKTLQMQASASRVCWPNHALLTTSTHSVDQGTPTSLSTCPENNCSCMFSFTTSCRASAFRVFYCPSWSHTGLFRESLCCTDPYTLDC